MNIKGEVTRLPQHHLYHITFPKLILNVHAKSLQSCLTLCDAMDCSLLGSSVHGDSPGKNPGVGCCALLQGVFPMQGLKPRLLLLSAVAGGFFATSATWEAPDS